MNSLSRPHLVVDLAPYLYPPHLWQEDNSPLHFIKLIRDHYVKTYNDPFFKVEHDELPSWFKFFVYIELYYQLPAVAFALYKFIGRSGTTGGTELWCLVYGVVTALTTLTCIFDVFHWDPKVYSPEQKNMFVYTIYGPWFVIRTWFLHFFAFTPCSQHRSKHHGSGHVCETFVPRIEGG
jgi:hypothetical protein